MFILRFLGNYKKGTIIGALYVPFSFLIFHLVRSYITVCDVFEKRPFYCDESYQLFLIMPTVFFSPPFIIAFRAERIIGDFIINSNLWILRWTSNSYMWLVTSAIIAVFLGALIESLIRKLFHNLKTS